MEKTPASIGNYLLAAMFVSLALVDVLGAEYLDAGLWGSLAAGILVLGNEARPWRQIALERRIAGLVLMAVAVVLFAVRIATDLAN